MLMYTFILLNIFIWEDFLERKRKILFLYIIYNECVRYVYIYML